MPPRVTMRPGAARRNKLLALGLVGFATFFALQPAMHLMRHLDVRIAASGVPELADRPRTPALPRAPTRGPPRPVRGGGGDHAFNGRRCVGTFCPSPSLSLTHTYVSLVFPPSSVQLQNKEGPLSSTQIMRGPYVNAGSKDIGRAE